LLLFGVNMVTYSRFPWFIFPALGMLVPLVTQLGSLWGDGVSLRRIFFGSNQPGGAAIAATAVLHPDTAESLASREILDGAQGNGIRRAVASRSVILEILGKMTKAEREMLPTDLEDTVK